MPNATDAGSWRVPAGLQASPAVLDLYQRFGPSYRWWVAAVGMLGSFSTLLTSTNVNVAIPDIMGALGITLDQAQWLATAFLASGTVTMLMTPWFIRALGVAATYITCMLTFIGGCLLGGFAVSADMLFFARVVQGASAGLAMPLAMVMISQVFPIAQRGRAMGIMSVGTVLAPALGPTLGGYLVDTLSWRWVFFIIVPFVVVSLPLASVFFPRREESGARPSFDWTGVALGSVFIVALLIALTDAQRFGWYDEGVVVALAMGVTAFFVWVAWELYADDPLVELRLFTNVRFAAAAIVTFTVGFGLYGSTYVFPLFLSFVSGLIPTESGLIMAPAGLVMAALFPVAGYLADISSHRRLIVIGLVLFAISSYLMVHADAMTPIVDMIWWYVIGRIGLACIFPSLTAAAINPLPLALIPHGSATVNFLRQLGGAFGVSLVAMTLETRTAYHVDAVNVTQTWDNAATMELMRLVQERLVHLGVPDFPRFEMSFGYVLAVVQGQGSMLAYRDCFLFIALVFAVSLVPAWFTGGPARR